MTLTLTVFLAIALDYRLGEPSNAYHPLVAFGRYAGMIESRLLRTEQALLYQRLAGILAVLLVLSPSLVWLFYLPEQPILQELANVLILYFCIAARSLQTHALAIREALIAENLPMARQEVGKIVSRQTDRMTPLDVRRAAIESVLENGADAIFAPLFWFVALGPCGALLYRCSNTLDAMWGYKNSRYRYFGWAAARLDDVLNWIPARLTAFSYALLGNTAQALISWRRQAPLLDSPNAGPVMTAGAGALSVQLGGPACYHGQLKQKPWFGGEKLPENQDISRALDLVRNVLLLWLMMIALGDSLA